MTLQWQKYGHFILTRAVVLYLAAFFLISRLVNYDQLVGNAIGQSMSRLTPPIDYFSEFIDHPPPYDRFEVANCINYHKAVAGFFAFQKAEAYGMLGFCYERQGTVSQAVASWRQAIALEPFFFWSYYNLGVVFYNQGKYSQAADYFRQALQQDPVKTLVVLSRSKVYNDVRFSKQKGSYDFVEGLKQGRAEAYLLMLDSLDIMRQAALHQPPEEAHFKPQVRFF